MKPARKTQNVRALAARALAPVFAGQASLSSTLPPLQAACPARDRALLQALTLGVARHWLHLQALLKPLLQKPIRDPQIQALAGLGLFQLLHTRIPVHAAIAETVEAARQLGYPQATGLLNAVLRRFDRERETLLPQAAKYAHAHPAWLVQQLRRDWPQQTEAILAANNQPAALTLRVNVRQIQRNEYQQQLSAAGITSTPCVHAVQGLRLQDAIDVSSLPGYAEGQFSVQDESAQLAASLLAPAAGSRVLDACAAPGGKTAHLLECSTPASLLAIDSDAQRVTRIHDNLTRLRLLGPEVTIRVADASQPASWAAETQFDAILLDAPCTATGVIRRHPDIKLLRKPEDVTNTVAAQAAILHALWPHLQPGGTLLYATCSVLKAENEQQIANFLAQTRDATEQIIDADWGEARPHGRQLLPTSAGGDGFYYALLRKR